MVTDDILCLGCGCLCDDIRIGGSPTTAPTFERACELGRKWFTTSAPNTQPATESGAAISLATAISSAAKNLATARRPLISGLETQDIHAQRLAIKLADQLRGVADFGAASFTAGPAPGRSTASLGEVAQRADVVVYWHCDPATTHPRHLERYSSEPTSKWLPNGRKDRRLVLVHPGGAATATLVDEVITANPAEQLMEIIQLRQAAKAKQDSPLLNAIKGGKYIAWFYDPQITHGAELAMLDALVIELQAEARSVLLPLGPANNAAGAAAVTTWSTGFANAVDFSLGYPRSHGDEFSSIKSINRGEVDLHLRFVDLNSQPLAKTADQQLIIGPAAERFAGPSTITINTAQLGIDAAGPVHRSDGVCLEAVARQKTTLPSARDVLEQIAHNLAAR